MKSLERLGRKRRDKRTQTQPEPPFAVESCECITEGEFALLRVTGTGSKPPATLVGEGESPESFEPLPGPGMNDEVGIWRMAFALPAELGVPGTRLWLHDGGVYLVELVVPTPDERPAPAPEPAPELEAKPAIDFALVADADIAVERAGERRDAAPPAPENPELTGDQDDPRARKLVEAWAESATLREKLADREAELAKALKDLLEARQNVLPLREYAEELTIELAGVRKQLKGSQKNGRKAAELEAELAAVKAKLEGAEPGLAEAELERKAAEREAIAARDEVMRLERELTEARMAVETAIRDAQVQLEEARGEAAAAQDRLSAEVEEQQKTADQLRTELTTLEIGKARRRGVGRRAEDRELQKVRAELEGQIASREQRIAQLEQDAASFSKRRDDALAESLRARVAELEQEVSQHTTCNDDLRTLLESERELVSTARQESHELKRQLAAAKASRVTDAGTEPAVALAAVRPPGAAREPIESPPWSALDDELLARIEKAKSLTTG